MSDNNERSASSVQRRAFTLAAGRWPLAALPLLFSACTWFTDFRTQPKIDPWESAADTIAPRAQPQMSVPITGTAVAGYQVSYAALPGTIDSMSGLVNPTPPTAASLANGRKYFAINCAVCHGDAGNGDGPAVTYGMIPFPISNGHALTLSDGYIFGMIRNGRGSMPPYNRIEEMDRWDVVNYVRGLQGRLGHPVPTGPVGYPGQTGDALPGFTQQGPTRPAPYDRPKFMTLDQPPQTVPAATSTTAPAAAGAASAPTGGARP